MSIKFTCPHCRKPLNVKDHLAGKKAQCPACKNRLTIPASASGAVANHADIEALAAAALAEEPKAPAPIAEQTTIEFKCYYCDETVRVGAELSGKQTPCPECRRIIKVPLLEKQQPKDWRGVQARLPAGARRDLGPAPEGAWDTASVGVSRQALVEAQAIPQTRRRLTPAQWIKRGTVIAVGLLLVAGAAWMISGYWAQRRQDQTLAKALEPLGAADRLTSEAAAELHRGAGVYFLRTGNRGSADAARTHFQQARVAILQAVRVDPFEREAFLIHLALDQIDLGGEKADIDQETRVSWDDTQKEVRQTLQNVSSPEGRGEALHQVTRKFLAKDQGVRAAALASIFPEEAAEMLAAVGLEMLRGKQESMAEALANQAQQSGASVVQPPGDEAKPPAVSPAPSLIALWLVLGKPEKAAGAMPPAEGEKERALAILVGTVRGLAYQGNFDQARARLRAVSAPEEQLPALIALAAAAEANDQAAAVRPELENAFTLAEAESKDRPLAPWPLFHLARAGVKAGLEDRVQALARLAPDVAVRGRMQLEVLRGRLNASKGPAEESWVQMVDANAPAHLNALEMLARQDARHGAATSMQKRMDGWDEKLRPFGYLGLALGLQDRNQ
ncbi:MAG TPA: hypothetical protein VKU02_31030 [Gemmataceae bacterium]|nr:hypothetical protein [Gemmataceae bacterium]